MHDTESDRGARLGVVLVNWNRFEFTIECLETLLRSTVPLRVVVVDNASSDGSIAKLQSWAAGEEAYVPPAGVLGPLSTPPLPKPLELVCLTAEEAAVGGRSAPCIMLIDAGANLGFAGGNNLGAELLLRDPAIDRVWLLNNDTVVAPDAAANLLAEFERDADIGMSGTVVRYYHRPDTIQVLNGYEFTVWNGRNTPIAGGTCGSTQPEQAEVIARTDFIIGASLCVSREMYETIGGMSLRYFLYYEEIDWATRNGGQFKIGYASSATVWHKEGGSIGSGGGKGARSAMSDYYLLRSRLRFYRRFYPLLMPVQLVLATAQIALRLLRGQPSKARMLVAAIFEREI